MIGRKGEHLVVAENKAPYGSHCLKLKWHNSISRDPFFALLVVEKSKGSCGGGVLYRLHDLWLPILQGVWGA